MYEFTTAIVGLVVLMFFVQEAETSVRVVLTADSQTSNVMSGETVRLICKVDSDPSTQWEYSWKKLSGAKDTTLSSYIRGYSTYTLSRVTESDSAQYWCAAKTENHSTINYTHTLTVTAPPPAVLTLNPAWRKFYPTEKVTLKCEIQTRQTGWSYLWFRDAASMNSVDSRGNEFTIPAVDQSHRGRYSCRGRIPGRDVYTEKSNNVTLTVDALPPVVLTLQTGWTNIFNTERATLHCDIQDSSPVWMHKWYRDGRELPVDMNEDTYEILSAVQSDSGTYTCKGEHKERVLYTGSSNAVTLKVNGEAPKPLLTLDTPSGEIFTGDTVTLSCRVGTDPAGWEYLWYKETPGAALTSTDANSTDRSNYTIHSAAVSHGGEYWCRAGRGRPAFYTPYSDSLQLSITVRGKAFACLNMTMAPGNLRHRSANMHAPKTRPQAVLTLESAWTEIFRSDSLTLRCQVEGSSAEWNYTWYRDGRHLPLVPSGDRLTLSSGNDSYSSEYKCRGNRTGQPSYTEISEGFRENNIVLKRKVLVSVASSVLLGLILTVLGCVCLRKKRKLAYKTTPQNMFFSKPPTENLYGDHEHFSNEEQSTEAKVLPPKQNPEDLTSFKAGQ